MKNQAKNYSTHPLQVQESSKGNTPLSQTLLSEGLLELLRQIAHFQKKIFESQSTLETLQHELHREWLPLNDQVHKIRLETFRILGKHLRSGWLNKKDTQHLEMALLDFIQSLEQEAGVSLVAERESVFSDVAPEEIIFERERKNDSEDIWENTWEEQGKPAKDSSERSTKGQSVNKELEKTKIKKEDAFAGDIRAIYLILARALHPDKESDSTKAEIKTQWMQKVTAAYAKRSLAELLEILAANPLEAVGPYLSQAPQKTLQGFAKRLRRDLADIKQKYAQFESGLDPFLKGLLKDGKINEVAFNILIAKARKDVKFLKQRRNLYATTRGVEGLVAALRKHPWHELFNEPRAS